VGWWPLVNLSRFSRAFSGTHSRSGRPYSPGSDIYALLPVPNAASCALLSDVRLFLEGYEMTCPLQGCKVNLCNTADFDIIQSQAAHEGYDACGRIKVRLAEICHRLIQSHP